MACKKNPFMTIGAGVGGSGGGDGALIVETETFDALLSAVTSGGDGARGVLDQGYGRILSLFNDSGTIKVVDNRVILSRVDDASPCFSVGNAASGANFRHVKAGSAAPTWGDASAGVGGLIMTDGTVWLACLDFLTMNCLGFISAAASIVPTVTTAVDNQLLGGVGFTKGAGNEVLLGGIANDAGTWESTIIGGDPTSALAPVSKSAAYGITNAATTSSFVACYAAITTNDSIDDQANLAGAYIGDSGVQATSTYPQGTATSQDTQHRIAIGAEELGGDLSGRCTSVSWQYHGRDGGNVYP